MNKKAAETLLRAVREPRRPGALKAIADASDGEEALIAQLRAEKTLSLWWD